MIYLQLPQFEIDDVEFCYEKKQVYFTLVHGCIALICYMSADEKIDQYEINIDSNPQNNVDRDFKWLEVADTGVVIEHGDIGVCIKEGQLIGLTEVQRDKLNEILKNEMVLV